MATKAYTVRQGMTLHLERFGKDSRGFQTVKTTTYDAGESVDLSKEDALKYAHQLDPDPNFEVEEKKGKADQNQSS